MLIVIQCCSIKTISYTAKTQKQCSKDKIFHSFPLFDFLDFLVGLLALVGLFLEAVFGFCDSFCPIFVRQCQGGIRAGRRAGTPARGRSPRGLRAARLWPCRS